MRRKITPQTYASLPPAATGPLDTGGRPEALLSLREAAEQLGLPYFKLQRAARMGLIPTYRFFNSRALVRLSEVLSVIQASRTGGRE